MMSLFQQQPMQDEWIKEELVRSQRQELFRWAADRVRSSVKEGTWRAFWLTAVDDQPVEDVAMELGITVGAVYIARSRVLAKLREVVKGWEDQDHAL
jgi:RNA polymerase sigma-70 factor (ECF subfamily)